VTRPPAILVTRPEPGAAETAARVAALGLTPILAPALLLTRRPFTIPRVQAVLLTSRAAARALPASPGIPVLAVGEATAEAARAAGWRAEAAGGTAEDLARLAAARLDPAKGPLLLAVGQGYALDLQADLRQRGFRVIRRVAYAATPAPSLPEPALAALRAGEVSAMLAHSPRSALCAITLLRAAGFGEEVGGIELLAISRRVADAAIRAMAPFAWRTVRVAARPDESSLLALLGGWGNPAPGGAVPAGEP
jgi:uroporphyrinogen-III synthase